MLNYTEAFGKLVQDMLPLYDEREAQAIADALLLHLTGKTRLQRNQYKDSPMPHDEEQQYQRARQRLVAGEPMQYVIGEAWFMGQPYYVDRNVLIPRPETEELAHWVTTDHKGKPGNMLHILDVGTGSGCIPISLKLALPAAKVTSCDISMDALQVAARNAANLHADVNFMQINFLDTAERNKLDTFHVIVSNPPYIPATEKEKLHTNVREHEPGLALFVPDNDALVFYKAIADFGRQHLATNGYIYCELDAGHVMECKQVFEDAGYAGVIIKKDMSDNWRMLRASLPG